MPRQIPAINRSRPGRRWFLPVAGGGTCRRGAGRILGLPAGEPVEKSVTHDEIVHVTAGYSYWRFNDYRLQPENGNLPQRWRRCRCCSATTRFLARHRAMADSRSMGAGRPMVLQAGQRRHRHAATRAGRVRRVRRDAGRPGLVVVAPPLWRRGGHVILLLYVLSPAILANGALATSDTAAALFFLVATLAWWRCCIASPSPGCC